MSDIKSDIKSVTGSVTGSVTSGMSYKRFSKFTMSILNGLIMSMCISLIANEVSAQESVRREAKKGSTAREPTAKPNENPETRPTSPVQVSLRGRFLTQLHLRNDSDFDSSQRHHDLDGQSDGQIASFFNPTMTARVGREVMVRYQLELGWNAWSRNDPGQPNQFFTMRTPGLLARHKLAWGQWRGEGVRVRAGFQRVRDPSGLFLDHTIGALTTRFNLNERSRQRQHLTLLAGQIPDTTIEGFDIRNDNLITDSFLFGARHFGVLARGVELHSALYYLADRRALKRPLDLGVAAFSVRFKRDTLRFWAEFVGQYGTWANSAIAGADAHIQAWAAQMGVAQRRGKLRWGVNVFALSPDDDVDGNERMGAFMGSAKNRSASVFLTEDETRDRYDNLDERLGSYWGALSFSPAGLLVSDATLGYAFSRAHSAQFVLALGATLNPNRVFGERFAGTEVSILQTFKLGEYAHATLNLLTFLPGGAGAAMINDIKRSARKALFGGSIGFGVHF